MQKDHVADDWKAALKFRREIVLVPGNSPTRFTSKTSKTRERNCCGEAYLKIYLL
jgi:hypothetical protein